jgi:intracellular septation protein A
LRFFGGVSLTIAGPCEKVFEKSINKQKMLRIKKKIVFGRIKLIFHQEKKSSWKYKIAEF